MGNNCSCLSEEKPQTVKDENVIENINTMSELIEYYLQIEKSTLQPAPH
jgi:hypothetical protein